MKSGKVVVKEAKMSRLGLLSVVTWMAVSLTLGTAVHAADGFRLWKLDDEGVATTLVSQIDDARSREAVRLLSAKTPDYQRFVERFQSEPTHLVEGAAEFLKTAKPEQVEAFKKAVKEELSKVDSKFFGSATRKEAFLKVLTVLSKLDAKELKDLTQEELLKRLLSDKEVLKALSLTSEKPAKKDDEVVRDTFQTDPNMSRIGEQELAAADAAHQMACRLLDTVKKGKDDNANVIRDLLGRIAAMNRAPKAPEKKDEKPNQFDALKDLLKPEKDEEPMQTAQVPTAQPSKDDSQQDQPSVLDQQKPPVPQQMPQQQQPFMGFPMTPQVASQDFNIDEPSDVSDQLASAAVASSQAKKVLGEALPTPFDPMTGMQLPPQLYVQSLGAQLGKVNLAQGEVQSKRDAAQAALTQLTSDMAKIKGGDDFLFDSDKKKLKDAETKMNQLKQQYDQQMQMMQMTTQGNPMASMQAKMQLDYSYIGQQYLQAQSQYNSLKASAEAAAEKGNKKLAALKEQKKQLTATISDLDNQDKQLSERKQQIQSTLASINPANQMQQAGRQNTGTYLGNGGVSTGTRGTARPTGLAGAYPTTTGRGPLGGTVVR